MTEMSDREALREYAAEYRSRTRGLVLLLVLPVAIYLVKAVWEMLRFVVPGGLQ